jgi:tetratricopeptide (TPR) repeat protein
MIHNKQTALGIFLLAALFLFTGCATKQAPTGTRQEESSAPQVQAAPEKSKTYTKPAKKPETTKPLSSPLISSKFSREKTGAAQDIPIDQADIEFVKQRLLTYERKFQQWVEASEIIARQDAASIALPDDEDCEQQFERILSGYSLLLERLLHNRTVPVSKIDMIDPSHMQQLDIAFLESRCAEQLGRDTMFADDFLSEAEEPVSFKQIEEQITIHVEKEEYQEAILAYMKLLQLFPSREPDATAQLDYGLALQNTGQVEAAARHYSKMLTAVEQNIGPANLQRQIADLQLAAADPAAAISSYEGLIYTHNAYAVEKTWAEEQLAFLKSFDPDSEEMTAYIQLLREFMTNDYKIHGADLNEKLYTFALDYAGNPIADNAMRLKSFSENQLRFWFGKQLKKVYRLVAEKNFQEAMTTLDQLSKYFLTLELQAVLQRTYNEVTLAEARSTEAQRQLEEIALAEQWDAAVNLLDSQRYDAAILAFLALQETEYRDKAQAKATEAANLAAGQMRKEAASLFIKAGKTSDIERKKELLLASYQLLKEIQVKYPQTDLLDKVNQNLAVLEEQIRRIDPALLEEPAGDHSPRGNLQGQMLEQPF